MDVIGRKKKRGNKNGLNTTTTNTRNPRAHVYATGGYGDCCTTGGVGMPDEVAVTEKRAKVKKPMGHPPKYRTAEEMEAAVDIYFDKCPDTRIVVTPTGKKVKVPCPTITGLALFLGFVDRRSILDNEARDENFSRVVKKARARIQRNYESMLHNPACTGAIFALKQFGWVDRTEHVEKKDISVKIEIQKHEEIEISRTLHQGLISLN